MRPWAATNLRVTRCLVDLKDEEIQKPLGLIIVPLRNAGSTRGAISIS